MKQKLKYRHEMKHKIMNADIVTIKSRIVPIMSIDKNASNSGKYLIRSLYFDTPEDKALLDKINGFSTREKFRIRLYNNDTSFIRLEKKIKHNNMTAKISARLSKEEVKKIIENEIEFLKESNDKLLQEFYVKLKCDRLRPKSIVDYYREAYIYSSGNIRVTIDSDIRTAVNTVDIFDTKSQCISLLENNTSVLEVKYDEFIPDFILDLVQINKCSSTAVSKYAISRAYV